MFAIPGTLKADLESGVVDDVKGVIGNSIGRIKASISGMGIKEMYQNPGQVVDALKGGADAMKGINLTSLAGKMGMQALSVFGLGRNEDVYSYLVKTTILPGISFDEKVIEWSGVPYRFPGNSTYNDWTVTLNVDEGGDVLKLFNTWCRKIQNPETGVRGSTYMYFADQFVHMLDYSGNIMSTYRFIGSWPKSIGDVTLDYSSNEVATVDITFSYQYYTILEKPTPFINDVVKRGANRLLGK
jgi:hypothetical protein